jgi:hypothetical protein
MSTPDPAAAVHAAIMNLSGKINPDSFGPDIVSSYRVGHRDARHAAAELAQAAVAAVVAERDAARAETARLKRGAFTPGEFQDLCHHRDESPDCTRADFEAGCRAYQAALFGAVLARPAGAGAPDGATGVADAPTVPRNCAAGHSAGDGGAGRSGG